ncbi:MAG TPA: MFS transporter [Xanthobacteraceae bacterium]|nr:MFS transporter [Xanthobacteraceae bacterium]
MSSSSAVPFFVGSYTWNFALGTSMLVVPLYAHHLQMSGTQIGVLLGFPVVAQILFSLVGGAFTDRLGGRATQLFSFAAMTAAGLVFSAAASFVFLLAGQFLLVISRAVYWPASQTIASNLPGGHGLQLGRLHGITNIGQISGTAAAGALLSQWSFAVAFVTLASMSAVALVLALGSAVGSRRALHPRGRFFAHFGPLLRARMVYFSIACAYMAALPITLSQSFYPILLVEFGFRSETTGVLLSLRAVGAVVVSLAVARYLQTASRHALPQAAVLSVAAGIGLIPLFPASLPVAAFLLAAGIGSGVMTIYYQVLMSEISTAANRGTAMAVGGLGWGLSHLTTPLVMGFLVDAFGIANAFHIWGSFALLLAAAFLPLQRWARR